MTGFLLDTNVVSETRKRRPDENVVAWLARVPPRDVYLSVLTIGELRRGANMLRPRDGARAARIDEWVDALTTRFAAKILTVDSEVMRSWAELPSARPVPVIDSLLAATAVAHGITLATRNVRDVADLDVDVVDPWQS